MNFKKLNNAGENFLTESGVYKLISKEFLFLENNT